MPIRTNRGRTAVYRRLWGWPLRSPRHLIGTLVFLAIVLTALGIVLPKVIGRPASAAGGPDGTSASATPGPGLAVPPPAASTLPTRLTGPQATPSTAAPSQDAIKVAKEWAAAWVKHPNGITNAQWLEGLRPYTTDEYLPVMSTVDPANIPATKVTGEPAVMTSYTSSMKLVVPTDGPKLSITVVNSPAGWRVSDYDQAS
ncbi:hypothetical protein [Amycolatopsis sp. NPDC059021]|uniref:hypothetical protein n=1 Tax=Amycolatopsis sp. NPDC059021 TaxID=3346704 RepID=UPI00366FF41C